MPTHLQRLARSYTIAKAAEIVGSNPSSVWRWVSRGVDMGPSRPRLFLKATRLPGAWRIAPVDLEEFLAAYNAGRQENDHSAPPAGDPAERPSALRANAALEAAGW